MNKKGKIFHYFHFSQCFTGFGFFSFGENCYFAFSGRTPSPPHHGDPTKKILKKYLRFPIFFICKIKNMYKIICRYSQPVTMSFVDNNFEFIDNFDEIDDIEISNDDQSSHTDDKPILNHDDVIIEKDDIPNPFIHNYHNYDEILNEMENYMSSHIEDDISRDNNDEFAHDNNGNSSPKHTGYYSISIFDYEIILHLLLLIIVIHFFEVYNLYPLAEINLFKFKMFS